MKSIALLALIAGVTLSNRVAPVPANNYATFPNYSKIESGYRPTTTTTTTVPAASPSSTSATAKNFGGWEKFNRLDVATFKSTVLKETESVWVVAFIDPSCRLCQNLSVEWGKLIQLESIGLRKVKFGYIDVTV